MVAREAIDKGAKEIVLTGVNIGDYGKKSDESFLGLIKDSTILILKEFAFPLSNPIYLQMILSNFALNQKNSCHIFMYLFNPGQIKYLSK